MTNLEEWLEIGTIVAPQGLKGELRVYPNSDFPERFENPGQRWLLPPGKTELQPIELLSGRHVPGKNLYVVQLAGIEDYNQADALRGWKFMVHQSDRPILGEDEYHVRDLVGLEVFNQLTGEIVGVVVDLIAAGNDLLVVRRDSAAENENQESSANKEILIPFVKAIAPVVDLDRKRIEITPPPGLLELT
jgi:16S rRNA processing protein RimM